MAKGDDLEERLIDFAVAVIRFTTDLPKSDAAKHISSQLLRSGTAGAPNYTEGRGAESSKDFVHKLRIALKELNETRVWLKIATRSGLANPEDTKEVNRECDELCRILGASIQTTRRRTG